MYCKMYLTFPPSALSKLLDMKLTVDGLEKERDFYFGKLRDIEVICQEHDGESSPVLSKIIDILYATEVITITRSHIPKYVYTNVS